MSKQPNKQRFYASAQTIQPKPSVPQAAITQAQYTTQLSRPSTKATYSCHRCRHRKLTCDNHIHRPCTNCSRSKTTQPCEDLPRDSFEIYFPHDTRVCYQPIVPMHQYVVEQGWQLGPRKQAPWETQAQLAPWGSEVLNGQAAGTAEEPMSVTTNVLGDSGPAGGALGFGGAGWTGYGNGGGADVYHY